ncbi:hypothetical protein TrLO_g6971 [Triparma laevis f. longispina]|uniref:HMG box domain-containing protein n=1 Tax=Triparma laevis f. longispina TaxID=1714387 RepID=A0A9W7E8B1_9STRA|nr:hypothetical protein TrLO_g6971 [Triparma laevis f. longispina]
MELLSEYIIDCGGTSDHLKGWYVTIESRKTGTTQGSSDTYYFSPKNKKFRSRTEVARHFGLIAGAPKGGVETIETEDGFKLTAQGTPRHSFFLDEPFASGRGPKPVKGGRKVGSLSPVNDVNRMQRKWVVVPTLKGPKKRKWTTQIKDVKKATPEPPQQQKQPARAKTPPPSSSSSRSRTPPPLFSPRILTRPLKTTSKSPRKVKSSYLYYQKEQAPLLLAEHPSLSKSPGYLSKISGLNWHKMTPSEKRPYDLDALVELNNPPPTKNHTTFTIFQAKTLPELREKEPESDWNDNIKHVSELWKSLHINEKNRYEALAKKDKERYEREMEEYRRRPKRPKPWRKGYMIFLSTKDAEKLEEAEKFAERIKKEWEELGEKGRRRWVREGEEEEKRFWREMEVYEGIIVREEEERKRRERENKSNPNSTESENIEHALFSLGPKKEEIGMDLAELSKYKKSEFKAEQDKNKKLARTTLVSHMPNGTNIVHPTWGAGVVRKVSKSWMKANFVEHKIKAFRASEVESIEGVSVQELYAQGVKETLVPRREGIKPGFKPWAKSKEMRQAEKERMIGKHKRPLGRARKGKVWDYDIGDWVDFVGDQALIESQKFGSGGLVVKDGVIRAAQRQTVHTGEEEEDQKELGKFAVRRAKEKHLVVGGFFGVDVSGIVIKGGKKKKKKEEEAALSYELPVGQMTAEELEVAAFLSMREKPKSPTPMEVETAVSVPLVVDHAIIGGAPPPEAAPVVEMQPEKVQPEVTSSSPPHPPPPEEESGDLLRTT